jgi:hypothetical protein
VVASLRASDVNLIFRLVSFDDRPFPLRSSRINFFRGKTSLGILIDRIIGPFKSRPRDCDKAINIQVKSGVRCVARVGFIFFGPYGHSVS